AHTADRHGTLDALIGGSDPDGTGPAAGDASDTDPLLVDVLTAHEVIDGANAVPALDTCRSVAGRLPPPAALTVGAVMDARDFTELQCIEHQAVVTIRREPHGVVLVRRVRLIAVASALGVAAKIQDCGQPSLVGFGGSIQVACNVEARPTLK